MKAGSVPGVLMFPSPPVTIEAEVGLRPDVSRAH